MFAGLAGFWMAMEGRKNANMSSNRLSKVKTEREQLLDIVEKWLVLVKVENITQVMVYTSIGLSEGKFYADYRKIGKILPTNAVWNRKLLYYFLKTLKGKNKCQIKDVILYLCLTRMPADGDKEVIDEGDYSLEEWAIALKNLPDHYKASRSSIDAIKKGYDFKINSSSYDLMSNNDVGVHLNDWKTVLKLSQRSLKGVSLFLLYFDNMEWLDKSKDDVVRKWLKYCEIDLVEAVEEFEDLKFAKHNYIIDLMEFVPNDIYNRGSVIIFNLIRYTSGDTTSFRNLFYKISKLQQILGNILNKAESVINDLANAIRERI